MSNRLTRADSDWIVVAPEFSKTSYRSVIALLQLGPRPSLLDLRAARMIYVSLFDAIARGWTVAPGTVPRLGLLLEYDDWVFLRSAGKYSLRSLAERGVEVEFFYPQQIPSLPQWFATGEVRHDHVPAIVTWLRTAWRPTPLWPTVLDAAATLVDAYGCARDMPYLFLELAALALLHDDAERAAREAAKYAWAALRGVGDEPSSDRCRVLRMLAAATLRAGEVDKGLALLETAISTATTIRDPSEAASALGQIGVHKAQAGDFAAAEVLFDRAIARLASTDAYGLRETLHHNLAIALDRQGKDVDAAEEHATIALALRADKLSAAASEDRALIAQIRARRSTQDGKRSRRWP